MRKWQSASIAVTAAAIMLTAACGTEGGDKGAYTAKPAGNANPAKGGGYDYGSGTDTQTDGVAGARPAGALKVADNQKLGRVLTDSAGFTLYRFDKDTAKPPKTTCDGDCAKAWPPVPAADATATAGIDAALLGEVARPDGSKQLTVGGWPIYRYAKDTKAGDTNGQGVGGTWFASAPDGKKAAPAAGGGAGDAGAGDGGEGGDAGDAGAGDGKQASLTTRNDPKLGEILVDAEGRTLYRFTKDSAWPMKSACTGECLEKWPVAEPVDKAKAQNVDAKLLIPFNRPDGLKQQTIDCWPLYRFSGDTKAGDTNGQGVGGSWYAVSPQGKLVGAPKR
ncbi:SCO0930 family lipoprotein [Streptomyces sp. URMC 123]|uniref:SCO0930 family lipoprotein n=1 Tax=Streptomyces sp. URMC 123 TaxID=3423403 RepID=UPI003F1DFE1F